ncbi:MAG: hypothetical protein ACKPJJ_01095, partial [Planctomycetaceae bacterium]
ASAKEKQLEHACLHSRLPEQPDVPAIRQLLLECIEEHYGCLDQIVARPDADTQSLHEISRIIDRWQLTRPAQEPHSQEPQTPETNA